MAEKKEDKARAEKQETGLPALENRVAQLERAVFAGGRPDGKSISFVEPEEDK